MFYNTFCWCFGLVLSSSGWAGISENQVQAFLEVAHEFYAPIAKQYGAELVIEWGPNNEFMGEAYTTVCGNKWIITWTSPLIQGDKASYESFIITICHELGHFFGGYPLLKDDIRAAEGQADYFVTQSCIPRLRKFVTQSSKSLPTSKYAQEMCDKVWNTNEGRALCYFSLSAVEKWIENRSPNIMAMGKKMPELSTPDTTMVNATYLDAPEPQCRVDTMVQGALCIVRNASFEIPGFLSEIGQNNIHSEAAAARLSCMDSSKYSVGLRPRCWFRSLHTIEK